MKPTISSGIVKHLKATKQWIAGGTLEHDLSARLVCKPSNVSRRCRELAVEGRISRMLKKIKSHSYVYYRTK